MDFEQIKKDIYQLYEDCLSSIEPFHRKLDLFIVPDFTPCIKSRNPTSD